MTIEHYEIGQDRVAKYGPGWEDSYLAGYSFSDYDDNDYYTQEVIFLVHSSVPRNDEAILERLKSAWLECEQTGGNEGDDVEEGLSFYELEDLDTEILFRHGLVVAYRPFEPLNWYLSGLDGQTYLVTREEDDDDGDEDE